MADPSAAVNHLVHSHFFLASTYAYPKQPNVPLPVVLDMLVKAPQIAQQQAFTWTMLDAPAEGTMLLVMISPQLQNVQTTDGCVWLEAEIPTRIDERGFSSEMKKKKTKKKKRGKERHGQEKAGRDQLTVRARRRYRLLASPQGHPPPNPNLWILHYFASEPLARQSTAQYNQLPPQITTTIQTRQFLANAVRQGLIPQKPFLLTQPNTWPQLNPVLPAPPNPMMPPAAQQPVMAGRNMSPMPMRQGPPPQHQMHPQQQYQYAQQVPVQPGPVPSQAAPPAKRVKHTPPTVMPPQGVHPDNLQLTIDEEEDTSRGDLLDHLSPREIATARYTQHHEWMEQVLGSVYSAHKIQPVELGFGLSGVLEDVTKGLFEQPSLQEVRRRAAPPKPSKDIGVGEKEFEDTEETPALLPDYTPALKELRGRVEAWIKKEDDEVAAMEAAHAARLAAIRKGKALLDLESKLRDKPGVYRFGFETTAPEDGSAPTLVPVSPGDSAEDTALLNSVIAEAESLTGLKIAEIPRVKRHQISPITDADLPVPAVTQQQQPPVSTSLTTETVISNPPPPSLTSAPIPPPISQPTSQLNTPLPTGLSTPSPLPTQTVSPAGPQYSQPPTGVNTGVSTPQHQQPLSHPPSTHPTATTTPSLTGGDDNLDMMGGMLDEGSHFLEAAEMIGHNDDGDVEMGQA
ncbi:DUF1750-domain-containing protein [Ascobolus immersus RN42]|uniref:DUF1750-domain-containing protein n=1 Tax=Ascobolus immersus RN42 TaxID=1160509 RepID=A0A3N4IK45_ASCIM|nr:DUF1750-domain-containing protein [Ascobolus immersus RN42]